MDTVPGKHGGTLTPWPKGVSGNPMGRVAAGVPRALRLVCAKTRNGDEIAEWLLKVMRGELGEQFSGTDRVRVMVYLHERLLAISGAPEFAPVIDGDNLTDSERAELVAIRDRLSAIAKASRDRADAQSP